MQIICASNIPLVGRVHANEGKYMKQKFNTDGGIGQTKKPGHIELLFSIIQCVPVFIPVF